MSLAGRLMVSIPKASSDNIFHCRYPHGDAPSLGHPLGTNLADVQYSSSQQPFINLLKHGAQQSGFCPNYGWEPKNPTNHAEFRLLKLDADGYPNGGIPQAGLASQAVGSGSISTQGILAAGATTTYPADPTGMRLQFTGTGTVTISGDVTGIISGPGTFSGHTVTLTNTGTGTISTVFSFTPDINGSGLLPMILSSAVAPNHVRNISLVRNSLAASYDAGAIYAPEFLASVAHYSSFRFMNWLQTNNLLGNYNATPTTINAGATSCNMLTASLAFNAPLAANATSGTLTAPWTGGTNSDFCSGVFSNGDHRSLNVTNGSAAVSWNGGLSSPCTATVGVTPFDLADGTYPIYFNNGETRTATFATTNAGTSVSWVGGLANTITTTWGSQNGNMFYIGFNTDWTNRIKPSACFYSIVRQGVPLEVCVALSNQINAHGWFNIPPAASDSYMTSFNQLLALGTGAAVGFSGLNSNLTATIELGNEPWNFAFQMYNWMGYQGAAFWPLGTQGGGNSTWANDWLGYRSSVMAELAATAWAAAPNGGFARCIPAINQQAAGRQATEVMTPSLWTAPINGYSGPTSAHPIKLIAIAPYIGSGFTTPDMTTMMATATPIDDFFATFTSTTGTAANGSHDYSASLINDHGSATPWLTWAIGDMTGWVSWLTSFNAAHGTSIKLAGYEGGQQFYARTTVAGWRAMVYAAFNDARMGNAYTSLINAWFSNVGPTAANMLHIYFDCGPAQGDFSWGSLGSIMQPISPLQPALYPRYAAIRAITG